MNEIVKVAISKIYVLEEAKRLIASNGIMCDEDYVAEMYYEGYKAGMEAIVAPLGIELKVDD